MEQIKAAADQIFDEIVAIRRDIHRHPEIGRTEVRTSGIIRDKLKEYGVDKIESPCPTAVVGLIQGRKGPGRCIALRSDIDALPVQEETGLPFASETPGIMMLTAAHILNDMKSELCGTVKLAFQPAEETAEGAPAMVAEGALEGVDGCFAMHVWSTEKVNTVSCMAGPRMASADQFKIDVTGKGGHGSAPHECVDAAVVSSAIVSNLQTIVSRETNPTDPAVCTVGTMQVGDRWNIVPERGHLEGTTRCFSRDVWTRFPEMIDRIAQETAKTFRASAKLDYIRLVPPVINDDHMAAIVQAAARKVVAPDAPIESPKVTGGEDFAFFMEKVPGAVALLGVRNEACDAVWPQHSNKYRVDEDALLHGAMLYAQVAMDFNKQ